MIAYMRMLIFFKKRFARISCTTIDEVLINFIELLRLYIFYYYFITICVAVKSLKFQFIAHT